MNKLPNSFNNKWYVVFTAAFDNTNFPVYYSTPKGDITQKQHRCIRVGQKSLDTDHSAMCYVLDISGTEIWPHEDISVAWNSTISYLW